MTRSAHRSPDVHAIVGDDVLLDRIGSGDPVPDAMRIESLLQQWREECLLDLPPAPTGRLLRRAANWNRRSDAPARDAERRSPWQAATGIAASIVLLLAGTTVAGSRTAHPGDVLWPVTQLLWSDRADSVVAEQAAILAMEQARRAIEQGDLDLARQMLATVADHLPHIRPQDGHDRLQADLDTARMRMAANAPPPPASAVPAPSAAATAAQSPEVSERQASERRLSGDPEPSAAGAAGRAAQSSAAGSIGAEEAGSADPRSAKGTIPLPAAAGTKRPGRLSESRSARFAGPPERSEGGPTAAQKSADRVGATSGSPAASGGTSGQPAAGPPSDRPSRSLPPSPTTESALSTELAPAPSPSTGSAPAGRPPTSAPPASTLVPPTPTPQLSSTPQPTPQLKWAPQPTSPPLPTPTPEPTWTQLPTPIPQPTWTQLPTPSQTPGPPPGDRRPPTSSEPSPELGPSKPAPSTEVGSARSRADTRVRDPEVRGPLTNASRQDGPDPGTSRSGTDLNDGGTRTQTAHPAGQRTPENGVADHQR